MSQINVDTIKDRLGTGQPNIDGLAKAWVNFNGTGTVAIRDQFNVSSITDNGTGDYTVNFTNNMPSADYAVFVGLRANSMDGVKHLTQATSSVGVLGYTNTSALIDRAEMRVAVFSN